MVDLLNGSMEWLFNRSTICLFGDKIEGPTIEGLYWGNAKVAPHLPIRYIALKKREPTIEKLFMETHFGICGDCDRNYLRSTDI